MRIAFVVQRYGADVLGGAESLCRWVAERMQKYCDVEVLTTCALDYLTWADHFPAGESSVNNVPVRRFPVDSPRDMKRFNVFARQLFANPQRTLPDELTWLKMQGPYSSSLLTYIKEHEAHYNLFIFVTYSYATTFLGLQLVPQKSILIPAAHDEPHFHFAAFQPLFHLPRGIIYNTNEERRLVHEHWHNEHVPCCVAGVGIEDAENAVKSNEYDSEETERISLPEKYLLYVGRIDIMKGCRELITSFLRYQNEYENDLHLVLVGKQAMDIPEHPKIHTPGFVMESQKSEILRRASIVVNPSEYESLSLLILEAWQENVPVLVNGRSDVLVEHCLTSNGGLYYGNYEEFALCVELLRSRPDVRQTLGQNGHNYVAERYSLDTVEKIYIDFITQIAQTL
ncbi:hexosyltransferase [candidate division KSB3 bacterium]|uniref:Hexosyltransferase n=1 Tax=candidate division KSB3 bacterium TaxID=2044937 RepID=A0A2G6KE05_9BACT|nr:MAG: hexosyltransferase [candidate division KSB3 bacterium]